MQMSAEPTGSSHGAEGKVGLVKKIPSEMEVAPHP